MLLPPVAEINGVETTPVRSTSFPSPSNALSNTHLVMNGANGIAAPSIIFLGVSLLYDYHLPNNGWVKFNVTDWVPNPSRGFMMEFWGNFSNNYVYGILYASGNIPTLKCGRADKKFYFVGQGGFYVCYDTNNDYYIGTTYNTAGVIRVHWKGNSQLNSIDLVSAPDTSTLTKLFSIFDYNGQEGW